MSAPQHTTSITTEYTSHGVFLDRPPVWMTRRLRAV